MAGPAKVPRFCVLKKSGGDGTDIVFKSQAWQRYLSYSQGSKRHDLVLGSWHQLIG